MKNNILISLRFLFLSVLIFGGLYTVLITGIGQLFFTKQANGNQITINNKVIGSELIGQNYDSPHYFSGRSQDVSQLSPVSITQKKNIQERVSIELEEHPTENSVPIDLVTASASGVDPHISVEAAQFQVARISEEREISPQSIRAIIEKNVQKDWFSDRKFVNVLKLNLDLDRLDT